MIVFTKGGGSGVDVPNIYNTILFILWVLLSLPTEAQSGDPVMLHRRPYNYEKAIQLIEKNGMDQGDPGLLYLKGTALKGLNNYQRAITCFEKLYAGNSPYIKLVVDLAECYQSLNIFEKSLISYKKAMAMDTGKM